jgi:predicted membrane protein
MWFIAVNASDIAIMYVSGAFAGEMFGSTFHTSRCIPAIAFCVSVFLTSLTLWDVPFGMRRFDFYYGVKKGINVVNILVVGVGFDVDEMYWQRFICDSLFDIPYICHLMSVLLQRLFDIIYLCRGMEVPDYHTEVPVLSWFICVKLCIFFH